MSARQHHRVTPGRPITDYERGRREARRERRDARDHRMVVRHMRLRYPERWADQTSEYRRGYEAGWRSEL